MRVFKFYLGRYAPREPVMHPLNTRLTLVVENGRNFFGAA